MSLKNCGAVPVDWAFNFPNDFEVIDDLIQVKVEDWADPGDADAQAMTKNFILDNSIFCISPKNGHLKPGEYAHILMTYSHEFPGPHRLPVAFRLRNGSSKVGKLWVMKEKK
jgi:cilia- and flagella-associated protein 65